MTLYRRVVEYYRPFAGGISVAMVFLVVATALKLLTPWPLKFVVDDVLQKPGPGYELPFWHGEMGFMGAVLTSVLLLVAINLVWGICNLLNNYWLVEVGLRALWRLRTEVFTRLQFLPLKFHDMRRSGDSSFRVAYDTQAIQTFFNRGFATIISAGLMLIGIVVVMAWKDVTLTLVSLAVIPFLLASIFFFAERIRRESTDVQQQESNVLSRVTESLGAIRIVHAFGRERHEVERFSKDCEGSLTANRKLTLTQVGSSLVVGIITACGMAALIYFGAGQVKEGNLTLGDLLVFLSYLGMFYQPLEQLSYTVWAMEGAAAGAARVFEVLDAPDEVPDRPDARPFAPGEGRIELQKVSFAYDEARPVLRELDIVIEPGKTVALVGGTGAGKTTVLSLIPRFYDPTSGTVRIDGQDVRTVQKASLRQNLSIVLQDTLLLNGTIRDNIAYGRPGVGAEQIEKAARLAQAEDFIRQLPNGLDTEVGERGVRLSGGQRQRLGIARAFLRDAPILLLDEPTSALDMRTEAELMDALRTLMGGRTTLIVTHRLGTVHHADTIYVLEHGRVAESGSGPELLQRAGIYAGMWNSVNK